MRVELTSVLVDNQEKALRFYTDILGFEKKTDIPAGKFRWLTVISPEQDRCVELLLSLTKTQRRRLFKRPFLIRESLSRR